MLINGWTAGIFLIRRAGPIVLYRVRQVSGRNASSQDALPLPGGFCIPRSAWDIAGSEGRITLSTNNSGTLIIPAGTNLTGSYYETTGLTLAPSNLPSVLPGVPGA